MDKLAPSDWSLIPAFLAVAELGSLSAAARKLGQSQPTLGRQIRKLERALGTSLFDRHPRGLHLTTTGEELLPHALRMQEAYTAFALTGAGTAQDMVGTVRLSASVFMSSFVLPPILAQLRQSAPQIQIELVSTDATDNLIFRAADIAIRMYRPTQLDIVTAHVADLNISCFAATTYLKRAGRPRTPLDLLDHDLIGYDSNDLMLRHMRDLGWPATPQHFALRCDDQAAYWQMVRAGCGIGFSQALVGRADPAVEELKLDLSIPPLPVWLAAHERLYHTPRVRRVWDHLRNALERGA